MIAGLMLKSVLALTIGGLDVLDAGSLSALNNHSPSPRAAATSTRAAHLGAARRVKRRSSIRDIGNDKRLEKGPQTNTIGSAASDRTTP